MTRRACHLTFVCPNCILCHRIFIFRVYLEDTDDMALCLSQLFDSSQPGFQSYFYHLAPVMKWVLEAALPSHWVWMRLSVKYHRRGNPCQGQDSCFVLCGWQVDISRWHLKGRQHVGSRWVGGRGCVKQLQESLPANLTSGALRPLLVTVPDLLLLW